jgi:hypothetical protein
MEADLRSDRNPYRQLVEVRQRGLLERRTRILICLDFALESALSERPFRIENIPPDTESGELFHWKVSTISERCSRYCSLSSDKAWLMIAVRLSDPEPIKSMTEFSFVFSS